MEIIKFIILGIVQGFTEPIPVSSSGHLLIVKSLMESANIDYELLSIITNFGSFLAICLIFRKDIIKLITNFFKYLTKKDKTYYNDFTYVLLVVVGTIPAALLGLLVVKLGIFDFLEGNIKFVGVTLLITGLFLYLIKDLKGKYSDDEITFKKALIIGLFQVVALIPGISRSGATIVGGMKEHLKRDVAFKFSFMLYIPISIATMVLGVKDLVNIDSSLIIYYLIATVMAFIFTYFSTKWFRNIVTKGKLIYFVYYCVIAGLITIIFL